MRQKCEITFCVPMNATEFLGCILFLQPLYSAETVSSGVYQCGASGFLSSTSLEGCFLLLSVRILLELKLELLKLD